MKWKWVGNKALGSPSNFCCFVIKLEPDESWKILYASNTNTYHDLLVDHQSLQINPQDDTSLKAESQFPRAPRYSD